MKRFIPIGKMADMSWVTDFTKGKLTYHNKKILNNAIEDMVELA